MGLQAIFVFEIVFLYPTLLIFVNMYRTLFFRLVIYPITRIHEYLWDHLFVGSMDRTETKFRIHTYLISDIIKGRPRDEFNKVEQI